MNSPRSAPIRADLRNPKSRRRNRTRQPRRNGRFALQNLPPPRPPLTTKHFSKAGLKQVLRPQTPGNPPAKSDRILPPLRFLHPPLIGMRRLRFESTPPPPHSRQPTSLNPKARPRSPSKTISARKQPRRSTPPLWLSARSRAPSDVPRRDPDQQARQPRGTQGRQPRNPF